MSQYQNLPLFKNEKLSRFELEVEGHIAFIEFEISGENYALTHTSVPYELRGKGIAGILVKKTFEHLEAEGKTMSPFCTYIHSYVKRNQEWKPMVSENYEGIDKL